jgi:hypothetical protein
MHELWSAGTIEHLNRPITIAVVTHWGFIRALTGLKVPNGTVLPIDPTRPDSEAEVVLIPETG